MYSTHKKSTIVKMIIGGMAFIALAPLVTMLLWNALMPAIFNLTVITYWQALGLLVLSKILFSGFSKHGTHKSNSRYSHPEYIKKFKDKMKACCADESQKPEA